MVDTALYYSICQRELFDACNMLWWPAVVVDSWLIENCWIQQRLWFQQCFNSTAGNLPICSAACSKQIVDSKTDDRKVLVPRLCHVNRIRWVFPCRTMRPPLQRVAMLWTLLAWAGKDEIYVTWCGMQCLFWKRSLIALEDGTKTEGATLYSHVILRIDHFEALWGSNCRKQHKRDQKSYVAQEYLYIKTLLECDWFICPFGTLPDIDVHTYIRER